ncbi:hypothetical protein WMZ97_12125 [Lentibacillus sp. N15]
MFAGCIVPCEAYPIGNFNSTNLLGNDLDVCGAGYFWYRVFCMIYDCMYVKIDRIACKVDR